MRDFFKGWRRRVGCAGLVLALLATTMWLRSRVCGDCIRLGPNGSRTWHLASFQNSVKWIETVDTSGYVSRSPVFSFSILTRYTTDEVLMPVFGGSTTYPFEKQWKCLGAMAATGSMGTRYAIVLIPYWMITLPITLLSALLLLWPQRKGKQ